jgi:hypothetical protein
MCIHSLAIERNMVTSNTLQNDPATWADIEFANMRLFIKAFAKYNNTLGFVFRPAQINETNAVQLAPIVKAGIADLKSYLEDKEYRSIPIGTTLEDNASIRRETQEYLVCASSSTDTTPLADFIGVNNFAWCGASSPSRAGFQDLVTDSSGHFIPVFLAEVCVFQQILSQPMEQNFYTTLY